MVRHRGLCSARLVGHAGPELPLQLGTRHFCPLWSRGTPSCCSGAASSARSSRVSRAPPGRNQAQRCADRRVLESFSGHRECWRAPGLAQARWHGRGQPWAPSSHARHSSSLQAAACQRLAVGQHARLGHPAAEIAIALLPRPAAPGPGDAKTSAPSTPASAEARSWLVRLPRGQVGTCPLLKGTVTMSAGAGRG